MRKSGLLWFLGVFLLAGCAGESGRDPGKGPLLAPEGASSDGSLHAAGPSGFYPLEIGNRWHYDRHLTVRLFPDDGSPMEQELFTGTVERIITGISTAGGVDYAVEETRVTEGDNPPETIFSHLYYRQDKSGLYFLESPTGGDSQANRIRLSPTSRLLESVPASGRAAMQQLMDKRAIFQRSLNAGISMKTRSRPGGAGPGEYASLVYPLHPGSEWIMRPEDDPFLVIREVEGVDVLHLQIGRTPVYRIKHELPGDFGPNDAAYFFYSRMGFLGYRFHVETEWTDSGGERLGVLIGDESELLDSLDLAETSSGRR